MEEEKKKRSQGRERRESEGDVIVKKRRSESLGERVERRVSLEFCLCPKIFQQQTKHGLLFLSNTGIPNSTHSRWQDLYSYPLGSLLKEKGKTLLYTVFLENAHKAAILMCPLYLFYLPWATHVKAAELQAA